MLSFDFHTDYVFEDDRVRIEPLTVQHFDPLSEISNEPLIWEFFLKKGSSREQFRSYLQEASNERIAKIRYPFVLFDKKVNRFAGTTSLYEVNSAIKTVKMGHTWLGLEFQRTGLNRRVKFLLFEFLFEQLGMERIGFGVHERNVQSIKALQGIGCTMEGRLRSFLPGSGVKGRYDIILYSVLKAEWEERVKHILVSHQTRSASA